MTKRYSDEATTILQVIGFTLLKINEGNYTNTYAIIDKMGITNIKIMPDIPTIITITLNRPGIFIGKAGSLIDYIRKSVKKYLEKEVLILLKEDTLNNHLYPIDWSDY